MAGPDKASQTTIPACRDGAGQTGIPVAAYEPFRKAFQLQVRTLEEFYRLADEILGPSFAMGPLGDKVKCLEKNFFSTFFLAVTGQLVGQSRLLPLYAMVNQGMRAWVTACDNILDDEYKEIFPLAFASRGPRVRSVLTLLLADRVVVEFATRKFADPDLLRRVGRTSLRALLPSALQECREEARPVPILPPEQILAQVHVRKTGDLFAAPLALPIELESIEPSRCASARRGVMSFGLACQIIDDIKDMPADVQTGRHSLLVSMVAQDRGGHTDWLDQLRSDPPTQWTAWDRFADATAKARDLAAQRFEESFDALRRIDIQFSAQQRAAIIACVYGLLKVPFSPTEVPESVT